MGTGLVSRPQASTPTVVSAVGLRKDFLRVEDLVASYGSTEVIHGISFSVASSERLCLLGPSGCGKTTTLQTIAGFMPVDGGEIWIGGGRVTAAPPEKREIGLVFQNYALFPHLSVYDNVAFGLKVRKVGRADTRRRVARALELVRLGGSSEKMPSMLSGGEQQRIAVARAIVIEPRVMLLDEPFSNLDARLRQELRSELLELLQELGVTSIVVTHDQEEAMYLADRIAVLNHGHVEQIGTPADLYRSPDSLFVARFIGESNALSGIVTSQAGSDAHLAVDGLGEVVGRAAGRLPLGSSAVAIVRPEALRLLPSAANRTGDCSNHFLMRRDRIVYLGHKVEYRVSRGRHRMTGWQPEPVSQAHSDGDEVAIQWRSADTLIFPETAP